jgi:biopolymer transport protein ExbD
MTPLVDVAFLLLTFFMFVTTMVQPQVMDVQVPLKWDPVPVPLSDLWTIYLRGDGKIFYNTGTDATLRTLTVWELRSESVRRNSHAREANALITALAVDPAVSYARVVEVLDQLNLAERDLISRLATVPASQPGAKRERRFSIVPLEPQMKAQLESH